VFADGFSLDDAIAVAGVDNRFTAADVTEAMATLVAVSLVSTTQGAGDTVYRLLAMTRGYAAAKLDASGERDVVKPCVPSPSQEFTQAS